MIFDLDLKELVRQKPDYWAFTGAINQDINSLDNDQERLEYVVKLQAITESFRKLKPYLDNCEESLRKRILGQLKRQEIVSRLETEKMNTKEVAEFLEVEVTTVYNYCSQGLLTRHRSGKGSMFFKKDVIEFLKKRRISSKSDLAEKVRGIRS